MTYARPRVHRRRHARRRRRLRPALRPAAEWADAHDWYTRTDVATVSWLEQQGYDTTYIASEDMHADGGQLADHRVVISGSHDEYWSQQMYDAAMTARDAGTSLIFMGANAVYWRPRFAASPSTGEPNRLPVVYKTIEGGAPSPTATSG